jgi:hypothetical protein
VKEDNWKAVVAVLTALMEQLPNELLSQAAMKFLPTLHEVCHPRRSALPVLEQYMLETGG